MTLFLFLFLFPAGKLLRCLPLPRIALALSVTPLNPFRVNWPGHLRIFDAPQLKIVLRTNCQTWTIYAGGSSRFHLLVLMCSCAAVQGCLTKLPEAQGKTQLFPAWAFTPAKRRKYLFSNTTLASAFIESIHMPKEKPESYTESIATKEGLPCPVVQLQPDTKARACA
jgi:hypothetical protein